MRLSVLAVFSSLALTGCTLANNAGPSLDTASAVIHGRAFGGQQAVTNATISVYGMGSTTYGTALSTTPLATTTTDGNGNFTVPSYTCPAANLPVYIVATGSGSSVPANSNLALMASLGQCSVSQSSFVIINEVTTAAAAITLSAYMNPAFGVSAEPMQIGATCTLTQQTSTTAPTACSSGTYTRGLVNATQYSYNQLVNNATGMAYAGPSTVNGVTITVEGAKLNTIANALAACVNSTGETSTTETTTLCGQLFSDVYPGTGTRPYDTIQAALAMALYPYYNVAATYGLIAGTGAPFAGTSTAPNDWTVAASYATTSLGVGIAGSATSRTSMDLDIDSTGRVWFPSTMTGAVGVAYFDPSTTSFSSAFNSTATPLVHPQYVAIDVTPTTSNGPYIWVPDSGSANLFGFQINNPTATPIVISTDATTMGADFLNSAGASNALYVADSTSTSFGYQSYSTANRFATPPVAQATVPFASAVSGATVNGGTFAQGNKINLAVSGSNTACGIYNSAAAAAPAAVPAATTTTSGCYAGGMVSNASGQAAVAAVMTTSSGSICDTLTVGSSTTVGAACHTPSVGLNAPVGIASDEVNDLWIANSGNNSLSTLHGGVPFSNATNTTPTSPNPATFGTTAFLPSATVEYFHDGGVHPGATVNMNTPYALGVDMSGNVWTISPGCVTSTSTACTPTGMVLTEVFGVAAPTLAPTSLIRGSQALAASIPRRPTTP